MQAHTHACAHAPMRTPTLDWRASLRYVWLLSITSGTAQSAAVALTRCCQLVASISSFMAKQL